MSVSHTGNNKQHNWQRDILSSDLILTKLIIINAFYNLWSKIIFGWSKTLLDGIFPNIAAFLSLPNRIDLILHVHNVFSVLNLFWENQSHSRTPSYFFIRNPVQKIDFFPFSRDKVYQIDSVLHTLAYFECLFYRQLGCLAFSLRFCWILAKN